MNKVLQFLASHRARAIVWRGAIAACGVLVASAIAASAFVLTPISARDLAPPASSGVTVTDRSGAVLRASRASDGSRLQWMPLERMDPSLLAAFVATEDRGFYEHHGVALSSLARAARDNLLAGRVVSGASTITMQTARLVANLPRGFSGKPRQLLWALRLETHLSKTQILEQYLNRVPLGQGAVGVESAAQLYFGASASNVSLAQAALLAGLARAPSRDNPISSIVRATERRTLALHRLALRHYATADEIARANAEPIAVWGATARIGAFTANAGTRISTGGNTAANGNTNSVGVATGGDAARASAAADARALATLRTPQTPQANGVFALDDRHQDTHATAPFPAPHFTSWLLSSRDSAGRANSAPVIRTTLDLALQNEVEGEVRHTVQQLAAQQVQHAAAVVLDNATGDVLAWVGSPDFNAAFGQVDMVISHRQPGSALKPFAYALAFDRGITAATILEDISRTWQTASGPYTPRNYDRREHGPVRAREALASSFNIPAVQIADQVGVPALLNTLRAAGFASLTSSPEHYGLGLTLGDGEVSLLEMANAYRALGQSGVWHPVRVDANAIPDNRSTRVVSAGAAALVLDVLSDPVARLGGFGETTPFDFAFPAAVKTGTSRHFTDNWAVAVTGNFTVAVWVGNFDGHPMAAVSGISGAGPLLRHVVLRTAARFAPGVLVSPAAVGAHRERVCRVSGQRAIAECPAVDEWFLPRTHAPEGVNWYREGALVLPARYAAWRKRSTERVGDGERVATNGDNVDVRKAARIRALAVDSPRDGDRYEVPAGPEGDVATIAFRATGVAATQPLTWSVDGQKYAGSRWRLSAGTHVIAVRSASGASAEARVTVGAQSR